MLQTGVLFLEQCLNCASFNSILKRAINSFLLVDLVLNRDCQSSKISNIDFLVKDSKELYILIHIFSKQGNICPFTVLKNKKQEITQLYIFIGVIIIIF